MIGMAIGLGGKPLRDFFPLDIGNWYGNYAYFRMVDDTRYPYRLYNDVLEDHDIIDNNVLYISRTTTSTTETKVFEAEAIGKLDGNYINYIKNIRFVLYPFCCPNVSGETAVLTKAKVSSYVLPSNTKILEKEFTINLENTLEDIPKVKPIYYYKTYTKPYKIPNTFAVKFNIELYGYSKGGGQVEIGLFRHIFSPIVMNIRGARVI